MRLQHRPDEERRLASRSLPSLYRLGQLAEEHEAYFSSQEFADDD